MSKEVLIKGRGIIKRSAEVQTYKKLINPELWRKMDDFCKMAVVAARLALIDADLKADQLLKETTGVILATNYGPVISRQSFIEQAYHDGYDLASAFCFPNTVMNMAAGMISLELGVQGINQTLVLDSNNYDEIITYASELILSGKTAGLLVGWVNEVNELTRLIKPGLEAGAEIMLLLPAGEK